MPVLSTIDSRGTAFITHAHKRAPEARERQENGAANYEPDKVRNCNGVTVLCVLRISNLQDYEFIWADVKTSKTKGAKAQTLGADGWSLCIHTVATMSFRKCCEVWCNASVLSVVLHM